MPSHFSGEKSLAALKQWLYGTQLYLLAAGVPHEQWSIVAATNLERNTALWLQAHPDPYQLAQVFWEEFAHEL